MSNKVKFVPTSNHKEVIDMLVEPVQASRSVPEWYKDLVGYNRGSSNDIKDLYPTNDRGSDGSDVSTKLCVPFLDSLTSGYIYRLEDNVNVDMDEDGVPILSWSKQIPILDKRLNIDMPIPQDCHPIHFGFKMNWYYETPPGYSILITHPLNRFDLPFYVPSGIVDADIWGLPVFIPFFLKRNFFGIIEEGTPIMQMIPIKREEWEIDIDKSQSSYERHKILEEQRRSHITAHYKKFAWQKKQY
jgi:hypothetical protein